MNNIDLLLGRLDRVRSAGRDKWTAACPAHDDRTPSLSVRIGDDGRVLLKDFGGCETEAILAALGGSPKSWNTAWSESMRGLCRRKSRLSGA